mmetsp:Transcript_41369/g.66445  ORF Transcript_41369/g.66445 Transcript_41369/m.66445 type:complete len:91 (-) Transcript_41369:156-428(-)
MPAQQHENLNEPTLYVLADKFFGIISFRTPSTQASVTKLTKIKITGNNKMRPTNKYNFVDAPAFTITPITHPRKIAQKRNGVFISNPCNI